MRIKNTSNNTAYNLLLFLPNFRKSLKRIIYILIFGVLIGCADKPKKLNINQMKLEIEIVPEDFNGGYSISWKDSLCAEFIAPEWNFLQKRPYELNCYITNRNNDTLGYYGPQSFQQQFAYFSTIDKYDSIVNLNFKIGINPFSTFLETKSEDYIEKFNKINEKQTLFEPVKLELSQKLLKTEIELIKIKN